MGVAIGGESKAVNVLASVRQYGKAIAQLADALALPHAVFTEGEASNRLEVNREFELDEAERWDIGEILRCCNLFGADLRLRLLLKGFDATFGQLDEHWKGSELQLDDLRGFLSSARSIADLQGDSVIVDIRITVFKAEIARAVKALISTRPEYLGTADMLSKTEVQVFYHAQAWRRLLSFNALWQREQSGLNQDGGRLFIALCDVSGYWAGSALEVWGVASEGEIPWYTLSREGWQDFLENTRKTRALREEESTWGIDLGLLTPEHFEMREVQEGNGQVLDVMNKLQAGISAAYLANSVQPDRQYNNSVLRFAGPRPSQCYLPTTPVTAVGEASDFSSKALFNLVTWAYLHGSPDKLLLARECLARELPPRADITLPELEKLAVQVLDVAKANFAIYLRNNTAQYFQSRQQALDAVSAYASTVEKTVTDLSSDLVDNLYKDLGVAAAAIAAALIQPGARAFVIVAAIFVHVVYLLFVRFYIMPIRFNRYQNERTSLDDRLAKMSELSDDERTKIRAIAQNAETDFEASYVRTGWAYIVFCLVGTLFIVVSVLIAGSVTSGSLHPSQQHSTAVQTPTQQCFSQPQNCSSQPTNTP